MNSATYLPLTCGFYQCMTRSFKKIAEFCTYWLTDKQVGGWMDG